MMLRFCRTTQKQVTRQLLRSQVRAFSVGQQQVSLEQQALDI